MRATFLVSAIALSVAAVGASFLVAAKGSSHYLALLPAPEMACNAAAQPYLVIGQSQAANSGNRRSIGDGSDQMLLDGKCLRLQDPVSGATGTGGSIWPEFGRAAGKDVMIANLAISGSEIEQWLTPVQIAKAQAALARLEDATGRPATVIWMQGETDAAQSTDKATYQAALNKLYAVAPGRRWIVTRESKCYGMQTASAALNAARDSFAQSHPGVTIKVDLDHMPITLRQDDKCHFTHEGQVLIAGGLVTALD